MTRVPALDVGGSHVAAAWVDVESWAVAGEVHEVDVDPAGSASELVGQLALAAGALGDLAGSWLGVAIPGPFEYDAGIGRYEGVGKFESLRGVDVGEMLATSLPASARGIGFVNDAAAFGLGEWVAGAASGASRAVAITLGTGVGSAFVDSGFVVTEGDDVPPDGSVHLLRPGGVPLEARVSTRAIVAAYGQGARGVREVLEAAEQGDRRSREVLADAFGFLGSALAPWLTAFGAEVLVVGGRIALAWPLVEPLLRDGLARSGVRTPVLPATRPTTSGLVGAAYDVTRRRGRGGDAPH
jgi:glucokinase